MRWVAGCLEAILGLITAERQQQAVTARAGALLGLLAAASSAAEARMVAAGAVATLLRALKQRPIVASATGIDSSAHRSLALR